MPEHDLVIAASGNGGAALQLSDACPAPLPVPPQAPSHVDITSLIGSYQGPMVALRVEAADVGIAVTRPPSPEAIEQGDTESTERYGTTTATSP